ncbi:hypothetical protein [Lysinibacillus sp. S2017]|nr:hypothetical protein [Lysinibacillus sp. S2017]
MKMNLVMDKFFEQTIQAAKSELLEIRNRMSAIGLRQQDKQKEDEFTTV